MHLAQAHRAHGLHFVHDIGGGAGRNTAQKLVAQGGIGPLEGENQNVALDLAQHGLQSALVGFDEVIEHKEVVLNILGERFVILADILHDPLFHVLTGEVHDPSSGLDAADLRGAQGGVGLELGAHDLFEVAQRLGLHGVERGDAADDFGLCLGRQQFEHFCPLGIVERGDDQRHDLGMFILDQFGYGRGVHPVEDFNRAFAVGGHDAREHRLRLVRAKRLIEHVPHIITRANADAGLIADQSQKFVEHRVDRVVIDTLHGEHGLAEHLNLGGGEGAQNLGGGLFAKDHHQDGGLLYRGQVGTGAGTGRGRQREGHGRSSPVGAIMDLKTPAIRLVSAPAIWRRRSIFSS